MLPSPSAPKWATDQIDDADEDKTPVTLDRHYERCVPCRGTGQISMPVSSSSGRCAWCKGYGWVKVPSPGRRRR